MIDMLSAAYVFATALMLLMVLHLVVVGIWAVGLRRRTQLLPDAQCPKAAVILCLRGDDPFLPRCLNLLLQLDYPRYDVRIVIDHADDPALPIVQAAVEGMSDEKRTAGTMRIEILQSPRETCSLKCSSLLQAVARLDETYEFIAQLDADTIPHASWLRELATGLDDDRVGAATGNRWYMPADAGWGTLIRFTWNAAAVAQMYLFEIAWGGTLAVKTKVLRESDLLDRWGHALCEDTMLYGKLKAMGLRVAFMPALMMVNREGCDYGSFFRWMRRQLLTAKLYHPRFIGVLTHGIFGAFATIGSFVAMTVAAALGEWHAASLLAAAFFIYQLVMLLLWPVMEGTVRRIVRARGEPTAWVTPKKAANFAVTNVVLQFIYPIGLLSALFLRRVDWRGVEYKINGPYDIELVEYRPYRAEETTRELASL